MATPRTAAALSLLVLLAGCSAAFTGSTATPSATPAPVPEGEARTPTGPPGVGPQGVYDPARLVNAHGEALANVSHVIVLTTTRRDANGTLNSRYHRVVRLGGDGRFHYALNQTDRVGDGTRVVRIERFGNDERVVEVVSSGNGTSYRAWSADGQPPAVVDPASGRQSLGWLFTIVDTELTGTRDRNGATVYRLAGGPRDYPPLRNVSLVAFVDARGVVREYRIDYTAVRPSGPVRVSVDVAFTDIGATTVSRPGWYDEAVAATNASAAAD